MIARKKLTVYEKSLQKTLAMRGEVARDLLPLFDHLLNLSADSQKRGYHTRAGRELLHARRLTRHK